MMVMNLLVGIPMRMVVVLRIVMSNQLQLLKT